MLICVSSLLFKKYELDSEPIQFEWIESNTNEMLLTVTSDGGLYKLNGQHFTKIHLPSVKELIRTFNFSYVNS